NSLAGEVVENLDRYELGIAAQKIYDFIWDSFCDWYIELTKARLTGEDEAARLQAQKVLLYVLTETLKLLHPFMPFITEEIYQALPHDAAALMVADYPAYHAELDFPEESARMEKVMDAIGAIRSRRSEMNVPPSKRPHLYVATEDAEAFESGRDSLCRLAMTADVTVSDAAPADAEGMVTVVTRYARCYLPLSELVDLDKERERLGKELEKNRGFLENQYKKLSNQNFVSRAPANVVAAERERAEKLKALIANLEDSLRKLG
ncbi:MAG: class I tRNA ligase family protein, partial [Oscillospiraceae bacterium]|nr:class I tRNA ligase family protein [Oscillospiraceae bacterium]